MAKKEQELRDKAKEAEKRGDMTTHDDLIAKADRQQHDMVLFDSITGAIYGPNTNGVTGYVARAVAPEVSFRIGQCFKSTNGEGSGICQHSCHPYLNQATKTSVALTRLDGRTGLRAVG